MEIDLLAVMEDSPFAIYTCDKEGYITFYNPAAAELWGKAPIIGKDRWNDSWLTFYPDGLPMPLDQTPMALTLKTGIAHENRNITVKKIDGTFRNLKVFPRPLFDEQGQLMGAHNTLVDISATYGQDTRNAVLSAIVESSNDAIISKDLNGIIRSWNEGARRIFGYAEHEAVGQSILMLIPDSRRKEEQIILDNIKNGNRVDHFETKRLSKNGKEIPISLTVSPIRNSDGLVVGASKVARDVSEIHEAAGKQAILAAIVESSDDAIISKQLDGTITSWNRGAEGIFGYTEKEIIGRNITVLIPADRLKEEEQIINNIKQGKKVDHFQTLRLHKDGHAIHLSVTVSPIKNLAGEIVGASKVGRDVTEQIMAQQLIQKYAQNLEMLNAVGKGIAEKMDVELIRQRVTDATTKLIGAAFGAFFYHTVDENGKELMRATLSGVSTLDLAHFPITKPAADEQHSAGTGVITRIDDLTTTASHLTVPHFELQGERTPVRSYLAIPVISNAGNVIGGLIFGHAAPGMFNQDHEQMVDNIAAQAAIAIDNSRLFEEVKSLSAKKDEFIALASHELKTPLTSVKGYLQVFAKGRHSEADKRFLNKALQQVGKLNTLIEDMLNMSKLEAGKLAFTIENFDLKILVLEVVDTFGYTNSSHQILTHLPDQQTFVSADRQRIEQALINLIGNAIKYSPGKSQIIVSLVINGNKVTFQVQDFGIGLSPDQQENVFTRFYRAEGTGEISGLGLGLYLTKQIINRHDSELSVSSRLGKGSTFYFSLPLSANS